MFIKVYLNLQTDIHWSSSCFSIQPCCSYSNLTYYSRCIGSGERPRSNIYAVFVNFSLDFSRVLWENSGENAAFPPVARWPVSVPPVPSLTVARPIRPPYCVRTSAATPARLGCRLGPTIPVSKKTSRHTQRQGLITQKYSRLGKMTDGLWYRKDVCRFLLFVFPFLEISIHPFCTRSF